MSSSSSRPPHLSHCSALNPNEIELECPALVGGQSRWVDLELGKKQIRHLPYTLGNAEPGKRLPGLVLALLGPSRINPEINL